MRRAEKKAIFDIQSTDDLRLALAKELIESLAEQAPTSITSLRVDAGTRAARRIMEAARRRYMLPDVCAETGKDPARCVRCIVDGEIPPECDRPIRCLDIEELDIEWG